MKDQLIKTCLVLLATLAFGLAGFAQSTFQRIYGGAEHEFAGKVFQLANTDFALIGHSASFSGDEDAMVMRLDSLGNMVWTKLYNGGDDEHALFLLELQNGDMMVTGYTINGNNGEDAYLMRTDNVGNPIWTKIYGGIGDDRTRTILRTPDGGYIISGHTTSYGAGDIDIFVIRTDSLGNIVWDRAYGGPLEDRARRMAMTNTGNFVLSGWTDSFGAGRKDMFLMEMDMNGNVVWANTYGESTSERGREILIDGQGNITLCGFRKEQGSAQTWPMLMMTDASGNVLWHRAYTGPIDGKFRTISRTSIGGIIATGNVSDVVGADSTIVFFMKLDNSGNIHWVRGIDGGGNHDYASAIERNDGGYLYSWITNSFMADSTHDIIVGGADNVGLTGCFDAFLNITAVDTLPITSPVTFAMDSGITAATYTFTQIEPTMPDSTLCENILSGIEAGIDEIEVSVFPNPVTGGLINIALSAGENLEGEVALFDLSGKKVLTVEGNGLSEMRIVLPTSLSDGMYVLRMATTFGILNEKIVLR